MCGKMEFSELWYCFVILYKYRFIDKHNTYLKVIRNTIIVSTESNFVWNTFELYLLETLTNIVQFGRKSWNLAPAKKPTYTVFNFQDKSSFFNFENHKDIFLYTNQHWNILLLSNINLLGKLNSTWNHHGHQMYYCIWHNICYKF
jgi:hypothetical protein